MLQVFQLKKSLSACDLTECQEAIERRFADVGANALRCLKHFWLDVPFTVRHGYRSKELALFIKNFS